jgi:hypothetical protein
MRHKSAPVRRGPAPPATRAPRSAALDFQIDRVSIEGAVPGGEKRFEASLRAELSRAGGNYESATVAALNIDRLDAGQLRADASPETIARHVAREIVAKLTPRGGMRHA